MMGRDFTNLSQKSRVLCFLLTPSLLLSRKISPSTWQSRGWCSMSLLERVSGLVSWTLTSGGGGVAARVGALGVREQREHRASPFPPEWICNFFFFFLAVLCGLQNLSSPSRDQTLAGLPGKSLSSPSLSGLFFSSVFLIISRSCSKIFYGSLMPIQSESNWMICLSKKTLYLAKDWDHRTL